MLLWWSAGFIICPCWLPLVAPGIAHGVKSGSPAWASWCLYKGNGTPSHEHKVLPRHLRCGRLPGSGAGGQPQVHRGQEVFQAECCSWQNPPFLSPTLGGCWLRWQRKCQAQQERMRPPTRLWSLIGVRAHCQSLSHRVSESGRQVFYNSAITTSNDLFLTLKCTHNFHLTHT